MLKIGNEIGHYFWTISRKKMEYRPNIDGNNDIDEK